MAATATRSAFSWAEWVSGETMATVFEKLTGV
jgi:hypothetical protein